MDKPFFRMSITRDMPGGGSTLIDVPSWNPVTGAHVASIEDMEAVYAEGCRIIDKRHLEMNLRIMESSGLRNYFTPEEWQRVVSIFDILAGRVTAEAVIRRWEDIREENAELERQRQEAYLDALEEVEP